MNLKQVNNTGGKRKTHFQISQTPWSDMCPDYFNFRGAKDPDLNFAISVAHSRPPFPSSSTSCSFQSRQITANIVIQFSWSSKMIQMGKILPQMPCYLDYIIQFLKLFCAARRQAHTHWLTEWLWAKFSYLLAPTPSLAWLFLAPSLLATSGPWDSAKSWSEAKLCLSWSLNKIDLWKRSP